jgi:predicted dehydrogenase
MPDKVRVGIVGLGFGQRVLLPAFRADPRCEVVGLCGARSQHAREVAGGLGIPAYDTWQALVDDPLIDAVAIATPSRSHCAIATAALSRKKHVFCEKPLADSLDAARQMAVAAGAAGTANVVDFELPETDEWHRARELVASGGLGRLRHVSVTWHVQTYANRHGLVSWKTRPSEGGGALNDFASHTFHYLEWLFGPILEVWSAPIDADEGPADRDNVVILSLKLRAGATVAVSICTDAVHGDGHTIRAFGASGSLALVNPTADQVCDFALYTGARAAAFERQVPTATADPSADGRLDAVGRLVGRFATWALSGRGSSPSFDDGLRVQMLLDAAWRSRREGDWCRVG